MSVRGVCVIEWRVSCEDGSWKPFTTFDYCFQCPLYDPPYAAEKPGSQIKKPDTTKPMKSPVPSPAAVPSDTPKDSPEDDSEDKPEDISKK